MNLESNKVSGSELLLSLLFIIVFLVIPSVLLYCIKQEKPTQTTIQQTIPEETEQKPVYYEYQEIPGTNYLNLQLYDCHKSPYTVSLAKAFTEIKKKYGINQINVITIYLVEIPKGKPQK